MPSEEREQESQLQKVAQWLWNVIEPDAEDDEEPEEPCGSSSRSDS